MTKKQTVVLAFSGGLDTSFCLLYLQHKFGYDVVTVTVDTGGFDPNTLTQIANHATALGAVEHIHVDGTHDVFHDHISYLIKGNVKRGNVYPLCVGAERVVQAKVVANIASQLGASAIAHGSTGAGNDQIRFDAAIRALCPDLTILAPVRDEGWSREASTAWLAQHDVHIPPKTTTYSINEGLWGVTIGGKETHDSWDSPPEDAYVWTKKPQDAPAEGVELVLSFEQGVPTAINGIPYNGVSLVQNLNELGAAHGIGRGIHVGDTIMGIKGRIAFEAPAATLLIEAHRELEKLVLTRWQSHWKDQLSSFYGMLLHEAQYFDPVMRDMEAFLDSSQSVVSGQVKLNLCQGNLSTVGARSPFSMMSAAHGTYGEQNTLWSAQDAKGFCAIFGTQPLLAKLAKKQAEATQNTLAVQP